MVAPKIEKMACQRSMAQRKKREKGLSMSQKKEEMIKEREPMF